MTAEHEDSIEVALARTRTLEPDFLGLDLDEARSLADRLGLQLRVIDSDDTMLTADLRARRMTVDVRTGTVTRATAG
ncbi:MAG TPA: PASTA domain-containing protein [Jatrophihabitans sp.]|nr:PASTA domain-containing protein [Jatrophihabitans sp.]